MPPRFYMFYFFIFFSSSHFFISFRFSAVGLVLTARERDLLYPLSHPGYTKELIRS
jgi:hypothetical protein